MIEISQAPIGRQILLYVFKSFTLIYVSCNLQPYELLASSSKLT